MERQAVQSPLSFYHAITLSTSFTSDSCKCTGGEAAACECKVSSPSNATTKGQMNCGCTGPTALECVCDGNKKVLPSRSPAHTQSSTQDCTNKCQTSCLETCVMLELDSKCGEICSDACYYSCKKQEKARLRGINKKKNEYKFIIPNESTATTGASVQLRPYEQRSTLFPIPVAVSPYSKKCELECMPDCSLTCTTLKPALELIGGFVDGKTKTLADCQDSCTGTCAKVCISTGVSPVDCATTCGPACEASCQQALRLPKECPPACMPSCQPECMEQISRLDYVHPPAALEMGPTPKLQHRCVRECKIQCDRQCAMYEYPGTNCEEACISSCFPVCQGKALLQYNFPGYGQQ
ncbi:unnamed protein product [Cylicocyclus nassatus]|uniref:Uncharacterized protein n=1 Tax=Cylicocyclus nassatus TaxID=53992 RepID=A0AA36MAG3_CYLNA|nr:unnamed protein product [Cylicocyclus nassatus]